MIRKDLAYLLENGYMYVVVRRCEMIARNQSRKLDRCCWLSTELPVDPRKTSLTTFLACDYCM